MNDLYYGNLNKTFLPYLEKKNIFTEYFDELSMIPFPNFYESLQENEIIMDVQSKAEQSSEWDKVRNFCFSWDSDLINSIQLSLNKLGIPYDDIYIEYLTNISEDLGALIMQLKNHYQRARPYQYALYGNQKLHPYETFSGHTPSYPSGHATQIYFLCKVIATHYEEKAKELDALAKRVADSRVIMGIHFPSDNDFGFSIAQTLLEKEDIISKYLE
jgi:hypothetical protein